MIEIVDRFEIEGKQTSEQNFIENLYFLLRYTGTYMYEYLRFQSVSNIVAYTWYIITNNQLK